MGLNGGFSLPHPVPRFHGRVDHALDGKGRLVVPARFRERLGQGFKLTRGRGEKCLLLYPAVTWDEVSEQMEAAATKDSRYWNLVRRINSFTEDAECDAQGRLLIPAKHREYAGLERDVVSLGNQRRVEIWAPERLDEQTVSDEELEQFAAGLGLN